MWQPDDLRHVAVRGSEPLVGPADVEPLVLDGGSSDLIDLCAVQGQALVPQDVRVGDGVGLEHPAALDERHPDQPVHQPVRRRRRQRRDAGCRS